MNKSLAIIGVLLVLGANLLSARVLKVPEEFSAIQEGVNAAASGDVVEVGAGVFREHILVKDGVTVRGAGLDRTVIEGQDGRPVVELAGSSALSECAITSAYNYPGYGVYCARATPGINRCKVSGLAWGIGCFLASPTVTACEITNNTLDGLHCVASYPVIENNNIHHNGDGIYCCYCFSTVIKKNEVRDNRFVGIYCLSSSPSIMRNTIARNTYVNVLCNEFSSPAIRHNSIFDAKYYNLELYANNQIIDASANYWGTTVEAQIKEKIWDGADQKDLGKVLFKAWHGTESASLTAPAPEPLREN
jgi:parallel beta-helix repeat protein